MRTGIEVPSHFSEKDKNPGDKGSLIMLCLVQCANNKADISTFAVVHAEFSRTSDKHGGDGENLLSIGVGRHVAETD